jgi:OOP family OmpA-OmpF porin
MNKKILTAALLGGLAVAQAASAQEFDDRWYLTGSAGFNFQDNDRLTNDAPFVTLGLGKFVSPNWSIDGELNYQNPNFDANQDLNWSQYGISFDLRRHFIQEGRGWNPYLLFGLGYQRSEEEFDTGGAVSPGQRKDGNFAAKLGVGLQTTFEKRIAVRAELAMRADFDDTSHAAEGGPDWAGYPHQQEESYFTDVLASVGVVIPLGPAPSAPVPVAPEVAPNCADLDDDGDGVNNCNDKCPGSQAGQTIGPDGCPVAVAIDLKGVNFNFDKATLRPDAVAILSEATEILKRYPDLRVEVAGHTDQCGKDAYNQSLSERRAKAVYDYLTTNGVDAGRLTGPIGYGESRPLEDLGQAFPACKSEKNRRTELNVQN